MLTKTLNNLEDLDEEILPLLSALNRFEGIETTCSCWGHNKYPSRVWFKINDITKFNLFLKYCLKQLEQSWFISIVKQDTEYDDWQYDINYNDKELHFLLQSFTKGTKNDINYLAKIIDEGADLVYGKKQDSIKVIDFNSIRKSCI